MAAGWNRTHAGGQSCDKCLEDLLVTMDLALSVPVETRKVTTVNPASVTPSMVVKKLNSHS